jgi:hypothetical protein
MACTSSDADANNDNYVFVELTHEELIIVVKELIINHRSKSINFKILQKQ